jgi:V-type H+-transporting ATPase subunit e
MVAALTNGTLVYFFITLATALGGFLFGKASKYNRDNIDTFVVCVLTAGVCMWMMWACTWMQQWHPLIAPMKAGAE